MGSSSSKSSKGSDKLKIIVLVGTTGCGKSQFIRCLVPEDQKRFVAVNHSITHKSVAVQSFNIANRNNHTDTIVLVDTPGFDVTTKPDSDKDVLKQVVQWNKTNHPKTKVAGILCLHRITNNRLTDRPPENLLKDLRIDANQVALVTTHWDKTDNAKGKETEKQLKRRAWASLSRAGAKMERFDNTPETAWKIIERLLYSA